MNKVESVTNIVELGQKCDQKCAYGINFGNTALKWKLEISLPDPLWKTGFKLVMQIKNIS